MNHFKILIDNFIIYGLGQMIYKIIPFVMLPIVVKLMPGSLYIGINDIIVTVTTVASSIGLLGMYDACFRLFFDCGKEQMIEKKKVCSTALFLTLIASCGVAIFLFIFRHRLGVIFFGESYKEKFVFLISITVVSTNVCNLVTTPTRILNQRKRYLIGNTIIPMISYSVSIVLLMGRWYESGLPLGVIIGQTMGILFFLFFNKEWFSVKYIDKEYVVRLLRIGIPLCPIFIAYWIYSSFDRIMISNILGLSENGIFSIANRLAQVSQIITAAFATGWSYYNFSTMNDEDHKENFEKILEFLFCTTLIMMILGRWFGSVLIHRLFGNEYVNAITIFPSLLTAPIVFMIYQLLCSQFLLIKQTIWGTIIATAGAIINVGLNYAWIYEYGINGAAQATLLSYIVIVFMAGLLLERKRMFHFNFRMILVIILLILYMLCELKEKRGYLLDCLSLILIASIFFYFRFFLINIFETVRKKRHV